MSHPRIQRLRGELKRELAEILRLIKDPRVGFVTVTDVEVTPDLRYAKVFVSVYSDEKGTQETLEVLAGAAGFVRTEVGRRVRMRYTPEIHFELDNSLARGARVDALLRDMHQEQQP